MEDSLFLELGQKMKSAGKEGLFETWMYNESDLIQAAGRAYTERLVAEAFAPVASPASGKDDLVLAQPFWGQQ